MTQFYPHNIEESRNIRDQFRSKCQQHFTRHSDDYMTEFQILQLEHIATNGLPDCYKSFDDFLYDFYPDFSWTPSAQHKQITALLKDQRIVKVFESILIDWNFDLKQELTQALIN